MLEPRSQAYLDTYLVSLCEEEQAKVSSVSADYFCADEYNANVCADLILKDEKTASCSMAHWYEVEGDPMPEVGALQVVTNWDGEPICIIEITSVTLCAYQDVTAEFAAAEGEGDKSLSWWRDAHWDFFSQECDELKITPQEDMMLVLERFKRVFPIPIS
ncbi:RNA-binding protein [Marinomonas sp. SBI22]|uniref:ASCH domain-containing protein n=1 Tax=unclassified Marinomonas TaxID=196814 RepID=UPI0007AEF628|nr:MULTISPECIES: ASCH domain-containing protein [unclassified Marinomonas]KZM40818.1 RNA-binding protein [Marinomonas sp. SBI8L]KZM45997.1 RNA-binding protein [Marinomonas sp. SBI22]